jgi:hypothetical protein
MTSETRFFFKPQRIFCDALFARSICYFHTSCRSLILRCIIIHQPNVCRWDSPSGKIKVRRSHLKKLPLIEITHGGSMLSWVPPRIALKLAGGAASNSPSRPMGHIPTYKGRWWTRWCQLDTMSLGTGAWWTLVVLSVSQFGFLNGVVLS